MASLAPCPELGDAARFAGWLLSHALTIAGDSRDVRPGEDLDAGGALGVSPRQAIAAHLGPDAAGWPVSAATWPGWDQVNVQVALDAWLAEPARRHRLCGDVSTAARRAGPGGLARNCVTGGVYLVRDDGGRLALRLHGPAESGPAGPVTLQVIAPDAGRGGQVVDRIRTLADGHNVYRGQVITLSGDGAAAPGDGMPSFLDRPAVGRAQVVLPADLLDGIERQVLGIVQHSRALQASGQHLKRGVLLHGAPGTGKSHTVRYLLGQLPAVTAIVLTGAALSRIGEACAMARGLQPSLVVVEDVDLIAMQRRPGALPHPLLFDLLNELDGIGGDADVAFVLTTSRADLLEEALAGRPGRVDHTARLPLPDAAARRRLLRVYQGNLRISRSTAAAVVARTDGVTASFIRELLRRAALHAAARPGGGGPEGVPLRVTARHFTRALDELLDGSSAFGGLQLGDRPAQGADALIRPILTHLIPTR